MTTAPELVRAATAAGAKLAANGDKLTVTAPRPLSARLVEELRRSKADILRLLVGDDAERQDCLDAAWWRGHFIIRTIRWELGGYRSHSEAQHLAYGDLLNEFQRRHCRRWPAWQCAGCDEQIGGLSALTLADGNRVHFGEKRDCLIRSGRRWRGEAVAGLRLLGLDPPPSVPSLKWSSMRLGVWYISAPIGGLVMAR